MTAKDLKNALLQEAMQGKLVPQIASEGNARDLLEEIRKERLSHGFANSYGICDGKDKKTKKSDLLSKSQIRVTKKELPEITEDEIPFEIPENWCWCKIGEIFNLQAGKTISASEISETSNGNDYLCYGGNGIRGYVKIFNREGYYPLIGRQGALCGNINFAKGKFYATEHAVVVETYADTNIEWAGLFLKALNLNQYATATAQPGLAVRNINEVFIPLPPLAEQKRIVAAIEKFMPLIEEYGKRETELKALNEQIGTLTKKAILQEAVQGKLVPQIASEGNAKDLLEEIRKERLSHGFANSYGICDGKNKKTKKSDLRSKSQISVTGITEDEIPFDIPESWCWCRLGEIVPFGSCQNAEPSEIKDNDWILDLEDIEKDSGKIIAFKTKKQVDSKSTKHIFKEGYVLYSKLRPYLNKCVIAPKDGYCTSEILPLDFGDKIYNKYAQIYLMSPFFVDYTNSLSFGVKMPRLGTEDGKKALFPLPPLAEQKRIVAAIEKLLSLCEKLGE